MISSMHRNRPILHATLTRTGPREVRHILIHPVEGETKLIQLINGVQSSVASGKQYEMEQQANALVRAWVAEGFETIAENARAFEPLTPTLTLAALMGFTLVYDNSYKSMKPPRLNVTGAVPLTKWRGLHGKNGADYEYAFDGLKLIAQPILPSALNMEPKTTEEFIAVVKKAVTLRDAIGPTVELLLGGDD
jgi:hypothetical protein